MSLIDYTNFIGKLNLPQTGNTIGQTLINQFIEIYEPEYLKKALGYDLWKAFMTPGGVVGPEQIINGNFNGSAATWTLGAGWTYGSDKVSYAPGAVTTLRQNQGFSITIPSCRVSLNVGGTVGFVVVSLGEDGTNQVYDAGSGVVTFDGACTSAVGNIIIFTPSADFNGSIDGVSLKEITAEQRWLDLLEGKEFEYAGRNYSWNGFDPTSLITPIANYVYYKYMEEKAIDNTLVGTATGAVDNNTRTNPVPKMIDAWNSMVEMDKTLWMFLKANKDVYPEWTYWPGSWDFWLWTDACKKNEVFHFKNSLDL